MKHAHFRERAASPPAKGDFDLAPTANPSRGRAAEKSRRSSPGSRLAAGAGLKSRSRRPRRSSRRRGGARWEKRNARKPRAAMELTLGHGVAARRSGKRRGPPAPRGDCRHV